MDELMVNVRGLACTHRVAVKGCMQVALCQM